MAAPSPAEGPQENLRTSRIIAVFAGLMVLALLFAAYRARAQPPRLLPAPVVSSAPVGAQQSQASIVLAGGCFWGVQAVFQHTDGVLSAVSGYAGGSAGDARYEAVTSGQTQHAEAVKISYDPSVITLGELLQVFFSIAHDPTEINAQGPDVGPQYRSVVFYENAAQRDVANAYIAQLDASKLLNRPIATEVSGLQDFYPAESEHQDYATRNPHEPYIAINDVPKIRNLQTLMPGRYRAEPVLVSSLARATR